jgi:hypothetical protein
MLQTRWVKRFSRTRTIALGSCHTPNADTPTRSAALEAFQYSCDFDFGGLREHVEGLDFLDPKAIGKTL